MTRPEILQVQGTTPGKDNDPEWPQLSYGPGRVPRRPERARVVLPWQALALLLTFALVVLGFGWWRYESYCAAWNNPCWWHAPAITTALVLAGVVGVFGWVVARLRIWHAQAEAERNEARQLAVRANRYGDAEPLALYEQPIQEAVQFFAARYLAATQLEQAIAPHKRYSGVETLNEGAHTEIKTDLAPPQLEAAPAEPPTGLAPEREWLAWVDRAPHLLIAGKTDSGKTTHATAILAERAQAGEQIAVLDPHWQPGKWLGIPAVGGGRDFAGILDALEALVAEMDQRFRAFAAGTPTAAFERLTVLVDEAPAIHDWCIELAGTRRRVKDQRWFTFARRLGSEARKVRISVILLTQSVLVQDLGINSSMRENFTRLALGDTARDLLTEEPTREAREQLIGLLRDRAYPAAMEHRGRYYVLENDGIPALAQRSVGALAQPWHVPAPNPSRNDHDPRPPHVRAARPIAQLAWLAHNTRLSTRQAQALVHCDYNLVVEVFRRVRGARAS